MAGESVSFKCFIHNLEFSRIIFRLTMSNGTVINSSNNSPQGNVIAYTISSVQLLHIGQYKCNFGKTSAMKELYVKCK